MWLWDLTRNPPTKTVMPGAKGILAWSPDGRALASVDQPDIQIRDSETGKLRTVLRGHLSPVTSLAYAPDGKTLASCAQDRTVRLWPLSATNGPNLPSEIVGLHLNTVSCLAISPDGQFVASGDIDGSVKVWNQVELNAGRQGRIAAMLHCGPDTNWGDLESLLPLPDHQFLVVTRQGAEKIEFASGRKLARWPEAAGRGAVTPDGRILATSRSDGTIKLWTVATGRLLASFSAHAPDYLPPTMAFSPDGLVLLTAGFSDTTVKLWEVAAKPKCLRLVETDLAGIDTVGFSPDGRRVAAALRHQHIWLFDPSTGRRERVINLGAGSVGTLATVFSPDSRLLATCGDGGVVRLWDIQTGRLHAALKGHTTTVHAIAFSPDGGTVATGSNDRTVRLWDVATGQERVAFKRFRQNVRAVAFSPDGNALVGGEEDGTIWMLRADRRAEAEAAPAKSDDPGENAEDYNSLAWSFATDPDARRRDGPRAVDLAERAATATQRKDPMLLDTLAAAYAEHGQFTNAVRVQQEAIALLDKEGDDQGYAARLRLYQKHTPYRDHRRLATRSRALLANGQFTEAEALARECLALREQEMPDGWMTFNARSLLGEALLGQKRYAEAEPLLLSGYDGMKQREGQLPPAGKASLAESLQRLVQLNEAQGKPDKAAEWKQRLAELNPAAK